MKVNPQPLISIIIPVYNVEKYLEDSINSIIKQTYRNIEIICINDGSTDSSLQILESFAKRDKRIHIISQENYGASSARNARLKVATGKYVYFFDSDDILKEDALKLIIDELNRYQSDIVLFDGTSIYETTELEEKFPQYHTLYQRTATYPETYTGADMFVSLMDNHDLVVSVCLQCFRREFLTKNEITFYEGIMHEDMLFSIIALLLAKKTCHLQRDLYYRRLRNNSVMTSKTFKSSFNGYFVCLIELIAFSHLNSDLFNDSLTIALEKQLNAMQDGLTKLMSGFEDHNMNRPVFREPYKELIAQLIFSNMRIIKKTKEDKYKLRQQLTNKQTRILKSQQQCTKKIEDIKSSNSYKIGRAITFLPGKIKTFLKRSD